MRKVIVFGRVTIDIINLKSLEYVPCDFDDCKMARVFIERDNGEINTIKFEKSEEAESFYCRLREEWINLIREEEDR